MTSSISTALQVTSKKLLRCILYHSSTIVKILQGGLLQQSWSTFPWQTKLKRGAQPCSMFHWGQECPSTHLPCTLLTPCLQQALQLNGREDKHGANTVSSSAAVTVLRELLWSFISEVRYADALLYMTMLNALKYTFKCFAESMLCGKKEGMA